MEENERERATQAKRLKHAFMESVNTVCECVQAYSKRASKQAASVAVY